PRSACKGASMRPTLYWIPGLPAGRLAIVPRPRGADWLEDEVQSLRGCGVDVLVCLLTKDEVTELDLTEEAACCAARGIQFVSFPIPDRGTPSDGPATLDALRTLADLLAQEKTVVVHCRLGVGRSALVAAGVLALLGTPPGAAFDRIA